MAAHSDTAPHCPMLFVLPLTRESSSCGRAKPIACAVERHCLRFTLHDTRGEFQAGLFASVPTPVCNIPPFDFSKVHAQVTST